MKMIQTALTTLAFSMVWFLAFQRASGETISKADAQALLQEAKKDESDRRMTAKETEAKRLAEDLKKRKEEIDELDRSIYKVGGAATEATSHLAELGAEKKRLTQDLDLINLRIEAEKLKAEGLIQLGIAHAKARDVLSKRTEEIDLRAAVVAAEIKQLAGKSSSETLAPIAKGPGKGSAAKAPPTTSDLRKQLLKAEQTTITASSNARLAMESASQKLQRAEAATAKAEKKQTEIGSERNPGFPGGNDPLGSPKP